MIGCQLKCPCGGTATTLIDGVMYILTEKNTIIFRGICDECGETTHVERELISLFFMEETGKKGN